MYNIPSFWMVSKNFTIFEHTMPNQNHDWKHVSLAFQYRIDFKMKTTKVNTVHLTVLYLRIALFYQRQTKFKQNIFFFVETYTFPVGYPFK